MTVVYHITTPEDKGCHDKGYIGIADDLVARLARHHQGYGNKVVHRALLKYQELSTTVLYDGDRESCLLLEEMLRPQDKMGWNFVKGGGDPPMQTGPQSLAKRKAISDAQKVAMRNRNPHVWICDGLEFPSIKVAGKHFNVTPKTIKDRCLNPRFTTWYKQMKDVHKNDSISRILDYTKPLLPYAI